MDPPILFDPQIHSHLIPSLVRVHASCITSAPYTIATFLPPLNQDAMREWWEARAREVSEGTREIVIQMAPNATTGKEEVAGYVMLDMPFTQTGPFRGNVEKLLVIPEHRKKGVARAIMLKLEEVARAHGRNLLLLDTEKGSPAEDIYPKLGYIQVGIIPAYDISPLDGTLKDGVLFYKDMR